MATPFARPVRLAALCVAAVSVLGACGGSDADEGAAPERSTSPSATAPPPTTTVATSAPTTVTTANTAISAPTGAVTVRQFQFMPGELVVKTGTTVTWTNQDNILHTATSGATPGTPDGTFDGPMDGPGTSFSYTFGQPGRYAYFCSRHTSMTGTVVVG